MIIRKETVADAEVIAEVTIAAFKTLPIRKKNRGQVSTFDIVDYPLNYRL
jgi:hypothetical protein